MDIQMTKMDGYMITREIRTLKNNKKANIPIVAMTANAFEEDRKKAFDAGMDGHIAKPIDIEKLRAAILRMGFWIVMKNENIEAGMEGKWKENKWLQECCLREF